MENYSTEVSVVFHIKSNFATCSCRDLKTLHMELSPSLTIKTPQMQIKVMKLRLFFVTKSLFSAEITPSATDILLLHTNSSS